MEGLAGMLGRAARHAVACCFGSGSRLPNGATAVDMVRPMQQQQQQHIAAEAAVAVASAAAEASAAAGTTAAATALAAGSALFKGHVGGDSLARAQGRPHIVPR